MGSFFNPIHRQINLSVFPKFDLNTPRIKILRFSTLKHSDLIFVEILIDFKQIYLYSVS